MPVHSAPSVGFPEFAMLRAASSTASPPCRPIFSEKADYSATLFVAPNRRCCLCVSDKASEEARRRSRQAASGHTLRTPPPSLGSRSLKKRRSWNPIRSLMQAEAGAQEMATERGKSAGKVDRPLVVVGSVNADIYVEIQRLPLPGETVSAENGQTLPGGKGANQAACAARLGHPTFFIGQVGKDTHGRLVTEALEAQGVNISQLVIKPNVPTGHAIVMLQPGGQNSIIIVGGANCAWSSEWDGRSSIGAKHDQSESGCSKLLSPTALELIRAAGAVLLQREIPEEVNVEAAKAARSAGVPVILDAGGMDTPISDELLAHITVFSPNETELARLTGLPASSQSDIIAAAHALSRKGVEMVLLKLGEKGSMLVARGSDTPLLQKCIEAPRVVDTTGAGDTFTAAFSVALVEGRSHVEAMAFAASAASLCVRKMGAMPSMPSREETNNLLESAS